MAPTTLTEFLLARFAEDEAVARVVVSDPTRQRDAEAWFCDEQQSHVGIGPQRMLDECEAKRRIVEEVYPALELEFGGAYRGEPATLLLQLLALPYADHPEYDERWKP
jgi:hypothetical protein